MTQLVFLDQNAWVELSKGFSDKLKYPREHAALTKILDAVDSKNILVPLTASNIYETTKINKPARRANMAHLLTLVSGGRVFRGRRRILEETLSAYIAGKFSIPRIRPDEWWFLSNLWFESFVDYSPHAYGFEISSEVLQSVRADPARALHDYLLSNDEEIRSESVRKFSESSADLISRIKARRAIAAGEPLAVRKRAYSAMLIIDELDFILATGRQLGLNWRTIGDVGSSLARGIAADVPILYIERELAVRRESQTEKIVENDLRDMASFITVLPYADIVIAENNFVNLTIQARLGQKFETKLLTSVFDF